MKADAKPASKGISLVTRQLSRNSAFPAVTLSPLRSVEEFLAAYNATDRSIGDLTGNFVAAADVARQKQDDILPHLSIMQALLSKKGANHRFVSEARKHGHAIPWWTQYYRKYKDRLWESLRTMERRIAEYRRDPSIRKTKREKGKTPKHLTPLEHKLLETATNIHEALTDIDAGHIDEAIKKLSANLPTRDRIAEHLERGVKPTHDNPGGDARLRSDGPEPRLTTPADELRRALGNEPDSGVASRILTEYLQTEANKFGNERIQIQPVSATVKFAGRDHRIMLGDFLEKKHNNTSATLSKCVGVAEFMQRRRVQEWSNGGWEKEHVLFGAAEFDYRVISEDLARQLAPEAFEAPETSQVRL